MALSGIDAQIMTQRATDTTKNASALNKRNELMQDYMALQRKTEDELQDRMVIELERRDEVMILKEHNGGQNAGDEQPGKKQKSHTSKESEEEEEDPGFISSRRIDIRI